MKKISQLIYWFILTLLVTITGLTAISALKIPGNYKLLAVQSGSMEPTIRTGSIVIVEPAREYRVGDIITVSDPGNPKVTITHRLVGTDERFGERYFITKGDANKSADTEERPVTNVLGKVLFSVPFLGYPVSYAKTRDGLIFLVIIPATLIVYSELINIKNETKKLIAERKKRKLTLAEKAEVKVGTEEMQAERWYHQIQRRLFGK